MGVTARPSAPSSRAGALVYLVVILKPEFRRGYRTLSGWRPEPWLVARLVRFGMPTGLQYSLEVGAFSVFMVIVGRIGTLELAASGIAFNLNMIVFMPMVGSRSPCRPSSAGTSGPSGRRWPSGRSAPRSP
jgi:MATE family multidrug resistance protein